MKLKGIKAKDGKELLADLQTLQKELFQIKLSGSDDSNNPARQGQVRKTIARVKTILRQREIAAANQN